MRIETYPEHWLDRWFWPILRVIWEPFSLKKSHFWHWLNGKNPKIARLVEHFREFCEKNGLWETKVFAYKGAKSGKSFWGNFWQRNFGWTKVAILELSLPHAYQYEKIFEYYIAFNSNSDNRDFDNEIGQWKFLTFRLTPDKEGKLRIAVLRGNEDVYWVAIGRVKTKDGLIVWRRISIRHVKSCFKSELIDEEEEIILI